jgi:hypothetical protein
MAARRELKSGSGGRIASALDGCHPEFWMAFQPAPMSTSDSELKSGSGD